MAVLAQVFNIDIEQMRADALAAPSGSRGLTFDQAFIAALPSPELVIYIAGEKYVAPITGGLAHASDGLTLGALGTPTANISSALDSASKVVIRSSSFPLRRIEVPVAAFSADGSSLVLSPALNGTQSLIMALTTMLRPAGLSEGTGLFGNFFYPVQGWAATTGGRGGTLIRVTNLNDSGTGSLRAALEASGTRQIVFEVAGHIKLSSKIIISNPNFSLSGQTAPNPGITITHGMVEFRTSHFIVEHIKFRAGTGAPAGSDSVETQQGAHHGIFSHCSYSWGRDETMSIAGFNLSGNDPDVWRNLVSHHITLERCIIAETLSSGSGATLLEDNTNWLFLYANFWSNNHTRTPLLKGGTWACLINNLHYNSRDKFVDQTLQASVWSGKTLQKAKFDAINNYAQAGPNSSQIQAYFEAVSNFETDYYGSGNIKRRVNGTTYPEQVTSSYLPGAKINLMTQPSLTGHGVSPIPASDVPAMIEASAGAFPWARDAIDARQFADFHAGTGSHKSVQNETGGDNGYPPNVQNARPFVAADWDMDNMVPRDGALLGL